MTVHFNTSRSRFDEAKRFTGVFQRMGQVAVDADWNEEVLVRTVDARRRTADMASGSPDDGFRICADFVLDPIRSTDGWTATGLPPEDDRKPVPELRLDRRDAETLPWVIRSRWHTELHRTLRAPIDLTSIERAASAPFGASALIFELRLERPPADEEDTTIEVVLADADGQEVAIKAAGRGLRPSGWCEIVVTAGELVGINIKRVTSWGVRGLPPVARTWVGALRAVDPLLGSDVVIRGGDGTLAGAGRMLVDGCRVFIERDLRYASQPDFPGAPALPALPGDGSRHHFFFLDVWEQTITALEDPSLLEPALDGVDTTARLRVVAQVRALPLLASTGDERLPPPTGGGTLTTNIASGALPDRAPPEPLDPCRDRCLFTENASTGDGYIGSDNLHVRVQVLRVGGSDVALWSRDNGSTVMALTRAVAASSTTLQVAPADAARLRAGDIIVIEDRATRLRWDAPDRPVLRRLRGVQADSGVIELDDAGANLTLDPVPLPIGGPVGRAFSPADGATVRRWDGADLLITGVRYRLGDGISFAFDGTGWRSGDYWTFTARVHAPDGAATGVVEALTKSPPHGPVHRYVPLARATGQPRAIEDLRPRYLPLVEVRDRLKELGDRKLGPGVFVVVVGDGERTFGDVDQSLQDGLTGDEALQSALGLLGARGGSIFIRAGQYQLEHPVLVRGMSSLRILGDGDATVLDVRGAGGAFYVDRCGAGGAVTIENLRLLENPSADVEIGEPTDDLDRPAFRVRTLFDRLIEARFSPIAMPAERALALNDIRVEGGAPDFLASVGARLRSLAPGEGRAAGSVVATLIALRKLQRQYPGTTLEELLEAQPLLGALSALPHGVVTIADSRQVAVRGCRIEARRPGLNALGVMVTGTSAAIDIADNRIAAAVGVAALPYAPYMASAFLVASPRAGLSLDGLTVRSNDIRAASAAATGVHVADGVLSGTAIEDNLIKGFAVGVLVEDQAEAGRDAAVDRIAVRNNRVVGATAIGIQITGDGVDVIGNEVQNAAGNSPFQACIQLTGHSSRVLDCWLEIPRAPALAPVALLVGVAIGEGLDDGSTPSRPVFDVEVAGNRIEGSGDETDAIGIVIGGSQPIYDVRVRDNVVRNLGDAALRTWSTSAPVGRLCVENNSVERVALGDLPVTADNGPVLDRLQPGIAAALPPGAATKPRTLLAALVDSALPGVRGPLDAALRWIERLTLRGALVIAGADNVVVRHNHLAEVGREGEFAARSIDGAEIRTAAIAVVAAGEVVVESNTIEAVRAPYVNLALAEDGDGSSRPEMLEVLDAIGLAPPPTQIDRGDVHLAAANMRGRLLAYASAPVDKRPAIGRALFGPLDAVVDELGHLGGAARALAKTLEREVRQLRVAQKTDDQTAASNAARATLSQACGLTAPDETAQDAWDAAAQFDLAMTRDVKAVTAVATRLLQRVSSLDRGLSATLQSRLQLALRGQIRTPHSAARAFAVASVLGDIAAVRDQQAQRKNMPRATDLIGPSRTIVAKFADAAIQNLGTLGKAAAENASRIDDLRKAKEALVNQLLGAHDALASDLAADFQDVDRASGTAKAANDRLRATLQQISKLAAGKLIEDESTEFAAPRGAAQARVAMMHLYARNLDRQIGGLQSESEESAQKSIASLHGLMSQLGDLIADEPEVSDLAKKAATAVRHATDATKRREQLSIARSSLDRLRGKLVDVLPPPVPRDLEPTESIDRRLAALGALVFELDGVDVTYLAESLTRYSSHVERALDLVHADAGERRRAQDTLTAASNNLGNVPGPLRARAVYSLMTVVDAAADKALARGEDTPGLLATATLLQAAMLAVDPDEEPSARVARIKTFLTGRTARISAALVAQAQQTGDIGGLVALLHGALARIARGVDRVIVDERPPAIRLSPSPADGVFVAGAEHSVRIAGNAITEAISGVVVLGAAGHVISEPPSSGLALEIGDNRVSGCTALGIAARPDGSSKLIVWDNHVLGCAGIAVSTGDPWGQAALVLAGAGDLVVRGNVLSENGNTALRALLHEIAVYWRGPVGVRGNTIRHLGGGAGGAGLLVMTEPIAATLITRLAQAPFLGVEPPPRPKSPGRPSRDPRMHLSLPDLSLLSPMASAEDTIELGGMRQRFATTPIVSRALTSPKTPAPAPALATSMAERYVEGRRFHLHPVIAFLRRRPMVFALPKPAHFSVHIEGNDIEAAGPALALLSEGKTLVSATIAGNDLRSRGRAGAAYLRRTDSTLFTGNRCECLAAVNVVVLRPGKAPVAATGNVVIGAEPVHRIAAPPVPRRPSGAVTLSVGVGRGTLNVPVDARKLLGSLDRRKNVASDTFAELLADIGASPPSEGVTEMARAASDDLAEEASGGRLEMSPLAREATGRPGRPVRGAMLSSFMLDDATRAAVADRLPAGIAPSIGARTLYGRAGDIETEPTTALRKLIDKVTLHEEDPSAVKVRVGAILTAASGDPYKALRYLDENVLGLDTAKPTVKESLDNVSLIHEVLGDALAAGDGDETARAPVPRPAPPPNPADHSLVVIGGTRVAVVGNATTAGVLVQEANAHIELNP